MKKSKEEKTTVKWLSTTFYRQGFNYYVTFRSTPPIDNQDSLESMISMFCQRLDRRILGRNYYKPENQFRRTNGVVVFQDQHLYDLHAHALFSLPVSKDANYPDHQVVDQMRLLWNGKQSNKAGFLSLQDLKQCVNPYGTIDIQFLPSEQDAFGALDYSLRKTELDDEEWKLLADHSRNKHSNQNKFDENLTKLKRSLKRRCRSGNSFRKEFESQAKELFEHFPKTYQSHYKRRSGKVRII